MNEPTPFEVFVHMRRLMESLMGGTVQEMAEWLDYEISDEDDYAILRAAIHEGEKFRRWSR
jgi:hypothetical protein